MDDYDLENPKSDYTRLHVRPYDRLLHADIIPIRSPGDVPHRPGLTPTHEESPAATHTPDDAVSPDDMVSLDEALALGNIDIEAQPLNLNTFDEMKEEQPPQQQFDKNKLLFLAAGGAVSIAGYKLLTNKFLRDAEVKDDDTQLKMTDEQLSEMSLYKDMIQVQYNNRKSSGRDASLYSLANAFTTRFVYPDRGATDETSTDFTSSSRSHIAESALEDNREIDVGDYKFVESGDLFALFKNKKNDKTVLAIRGLLPHIDHKDMLQLPNMIKQTVFKKDFDTDLQYKQDYNAIEDYLLNLPFYKDVVVTGHSRGGAIALELARKHNLVAHVFQPVTVRDIEQKDSKAGTLSIKEEGGDLTLKINRRHIYTNEEDYTPSNLVNPEDTRETRYVLDYDGYKVPLVQSLDAHQLHHFHKDATGYELASKGSRVPVNKMTEDEAIELGYDLRDDDDIPYDEDLYEIVYGTKEDINYIEEDYVNVKDMIIPTTREMVFSSIPFIPNNSTQIETNKIDTNGDGVVSYTEFFNYYKKLGYSTNRIKELFRSLDKNGDGVLSVNEL